MNDIEMKPCPFCGQIPEVYVEETLNGNVYTVGCMNFDCFVAVQTREMETYKEAADVWNNRAELIGYLD